MVRRISVPKAAMAVGSVGGIWHLVWVTLIAIGWAKPVFDFILELHFIRLNYQLAPFGLVTAISLVAITFCASALLGAIFAVVWNWLTFESGPQWARETKAIGAGAVAGRTEHARR